MDTAGNTNLPMLFTDLMICGALPRIHRMSTQMHRVSA
jgi:hypothetical protein